MLALAVADPAAAADRALQQGARAGDRRRRMSRLRRQYEQRHRSFGGHHDQTLIFSLATARRLSSPALARRGAIQADAARSNSSCMAVPAPATTCSRARSPPSSTRRSSRRCASRSSTSPAAAATTAAAYVVEQEGRSARDRLLHQYLADRSAGAAGRDQPAARHEPDRAARGRAGAGGGAGGFAVQDAGGLHRGGEGEARRSCKMVGRLDHVAREHRAPAADEDRPARAGRSSRSRPAASGSPRCSAAMST